MAEGAIIPSVVISTDVDSMSLEARVAGFGALADPLRLEILTRLGDGAEHCVCELLRETGLAANLLSYHLAVLRRAGLIAAKRRGRWVDYRLVAEAVEALRRAVPAGEAR
jgi:ArsR family transcriptional regulator, arsenate/arsenite/antimonite-responsive transcriptional repressor